MNLVFFYGPPSVGKYTVSKKVSELTGYKHFHNHLMVDLVRVLMDDASELRTELLEELRFTSLSMTGKADINTVTTLAYSGAVDDVWVKRVVDAIESYGGRVCFVELYAPVEVLMERIANESRVVMDKEHTQKGLQHSLDTRDHYASVKYDGVLKIDTSKSEPDESAQKVVEFFNLS